MSTTLDAQIDALYAVPLAQFVAARLALAKTVKGDEAKRIKALPKPTTVPWIVNQLRWHERALYERVLKTGTALRQAQVAALEGRSAALSDRTAAHRKALGEATAAAGTIARDASIRADADAVQRMLETISLADTLKETHGRFSEAVQPAGFEALAGIIVKAAPPAVHAKTAAPAKVPARIPDAAVPSPAASVPRDKSAPRDTSAARAAAARAEQRAEQRARELAEAAARHAEEVAAAERALTQARTRETAARVAWQDARTAADAAEDVLTALRRKR